MKSPLPLTIVLSVSMIAAASGQTEAEPPDAEPPAQAGELPDIPEAPPDETARPADRPNTDAPGDPATRRDPGEPEPPPERAAETEQFDRFEDEWDARFGARFAVNADGRFAVRSVVPESIAARSGLRANDVILSVDGQAFDTERDLRSYLRAHADDRIPMTVLRSGAEQTVYLHPGSDRGGARPALGVRFLRGPVLQIIDVVEGSPADQAGIVRGDLIVSMNGDQFVSTDAFLRAVAHADVEASVELVVNRHGEIIVTRPQLDAWEEVFDAPGTTVTTLRPDFDDDVDVIAGHDPHLHPAPYCDRYYWPGYRYWPYWTTAYAGPYFYAPYPGPIYYGPAYGYWPAWRYPVSSAWVW